MIGICIVTFKSGDVIESCLDSLLRSEDRDFRVILYDNASPDDTIDRIRGGAAARDVSFAEYPAERAGGLDLDEIAQVTLLRSSRNLGFAGGVNGCLRSFLAHGEFDLFWILNPDSEVLPTTMSAYVAAARRAGPFSLMGGRTIYHEAPNLIQSDGGRFDPWTGMCRNVHQGLLPDSVVPPQADSLDFISGANMVASRDFVERSGLLDEDYFLYYEEVDWAQRRGALPLAFCQDALVYHHGGTSIGTGSVTRRASGFANYFNYRNRMRFVWKFRRGALPVAYLYSLLKIGKLVALGAWDEATGAFRGLNQMTPPAAVRARVPWPPPSLADTRVP